MGVTAVCVRVSSRTEPVTGSVRDVCDSCSEEIWIHPSTHDAQKQIGDARFKAICTECFAERTGVSK